MRKDPLVTGEYYHIYNRGVDKRDIFANIHDLKRFTVSVLEFNKVLPVGSIQKVQKPKKQVDVRRLPEENLVSIVCYCFNPNHFHFILKQNIDGGISEFFKRLLGGYTKYFNIKYKRSGSLFQGKFKSNLIKDEEYFLKIRPYVNYNYLIHDIPPEKNNLVLASGTEYDSLKFNLVSESEALKLLDFYGDNKNFKKECMDVISIIREERGRTSLLAEDLLP